MKDERWIAAMKTYIKSSKDFARILKESKRPKQSREGTGWSTQTWSEKEAEIKKAEAVTEDLLKLLRQYLSEPSS